MLFERLSLFGETNDGSSLSFPTQASTFAEKSDWLYHAIFWISFAFFAVIIVLMVYFVIKYRRRDGEPAERSPSHNTWLEVTWTVVPCVLLVWMFYEGALGFLDLRTPPDDALEIQVRAKQWSWAFTYPNGETYDTLHLALNEPVKFRMRSDDVLHSFFIPEFRQKWDVVPGRFNETWAIPTRTSTAENPFRLYCAEYCGDSHSKMKSDVIVHDMTWKEIIDKYLTWDPTKKQPFENGEHYYKSFGCIGCHSIDGSTKVGPSFKGFWKTEVQTDKGMVLVDENYVTKSIQEPIAEVRTGFKPQMPNVFNGRKLNIDEIEAIIAYIKFLNDDLGVQPTTEGTQPAKEGE